MRKGSRVHDFLAALEEAAYEREDDPAEAAGLRELVNSLSSGKRLNLSYVDEKQREDDFCFRSHREHKSAAQLDELEKVHGVQLLLSSHREQPVLLRSPASALVLEGKGLGQALEGVDQHQK